MKKLTGLVLLTCLLLCCQQKQYFTSSPEIDLVKKANDAYYRRDWETLRSCYADTSKTWINAWHSHNKGLHIDTLISLYKTGAANYASFSMAEGPDFEMVVNDKGEKWVYCKLLWSGKTNEGKSVDVPVHFASMVAGNKVIYHQLYYDHFPLYAVSQLADTISVNP